MEWPWKSFVPVCGQLSGKVPKRVLDELCVLFQCILASPGLTNSAQCYAIEAETTLIIWKPRHTIYFLLMSPSFVPYKGENTQSWWPQTELIRERRERETWFWPMRCKRSWEKCEWKELSGRCSFLGYKRGNWGRSSASCHPVSCFEHGFVKKEQKQQPC